MATFAQGLLLALFIWKLLITCQTYPRTEAKLPLCYTRDALLSLRSTGTTPPVDLPEVVRAQPASSRKRRRGIRGAIRQRLRWSRPPLPGMILSNARSLRSKIDELRVNTKVCCEYRESSVMVFTETWLHQDIPDSLIEFEGFSLIRVDRTDQSGKSRGGGVCLFVNDSWCRNCTVRKTVCTADVELLCVSLRPFYLPREFGNIIICAVYVPPSGNATRAATQIADCVHQQLQRTPGAPVFILGDFNHCRLEFSLPGFEQYITCVTRDNRILDKCYGNVKNTYTAKPKPPLSNSDHNTVQLIPVYKTVLKRSKPQTKTVTVWDRDIRDIKRSIPLHELGYIS